MTTQCYRTDCRGDAHVLLFATGQQFLDQSTNPGQALYLCLTCGGKVYDALRAWRSHQTATVPEWMAGDMKANRMPSLKPFHTSHTRPRNRPSPRRPAPVEARR